MKDILKIRYSFQKDDTFLYLSDLYKHSSFDVRLEMLQQAIFMLEQEYQQVSNKKPVECLMSDSLKDGLVH